MEDYVTERDKLIPEAVERANGVVGKVGHKSTEAQRDEWNRAYYKGMEDLALAAGLMPWLDKVLKAMLLKVVTLIDSVTSVLTGRESIYSDEYQIRALLAIQKVMNGRLNDQIMQVERKKRTKTKRGV